MGKISFMLSLPYPKPYYHGCGSFSCYLIQHRLLNVCFLLLAHCMLRNRLRFPGCVCLASYTLQPSVPLEVNGMFPQRVPYFLFYKGNQTRWFIVIIFILLFLIIDMETLTRSLKKEHGGHLHTLELKSRDISSKFIMLGFRTTIEGKHWLQFIKHNFWTKKIWIWFSVAASVRYAIDSVAKVLCAFSSSVKYS